MPIHFVRFVHGAIFLHMFFFNTDLLSTFVKANAGISSQRIAPALYAHAVQHLFFRENTGERAASAARQWNSLIDGPPKKQILTMSLSVRQSSKATARDYLYLVNLII